jgi:hypothetical protein
LCLGFGSAEVKTRAAQDNKNAGEAKDKGNQNAKVYSPSFLSPIS